MDSMFRPSDRHMAEEQAREHAEVEPSPEAEPIDVEPVIIAKVAIYASNGNLIKTYDAITSPEYDDEKGQWTFDTDEGTVTLGSSWEHFLVTVLEYFDEDSE